MKSVFSNLVNKANDKLKKIGYLRFLSFIFADPNLFHINHRSVSKAVFIGIFWAMIPIPLQTIPAILFAFYMRANVPIAATLVWITNPLTMVPIIYLNYLFGSWVMRLDIFHPDSWSIDEAILFFKNFWQPTILGSILSGIIFGFIGAIGIQLFWRIGVILKRRKKQ